MSHSRRPLLWDLPARALAGAGPNCLSRSNPSSNEREKAVGVVGGSGVFGLFGFFSWIVSRINVGNISWASELNLDDCLLVRCPDLMSVICRKHKN